MSGFVHLANLSDIPEGTGKEFTADGRIVALYHLSGEIYALDGICPHAGGPLAEGQVEGTIVTCPWHGWQFDVTTGQHCLTENICQEQFRVRVERDKILVEFPETN